MPTNQAGVISVGLPSAGKTTYLAALWHVVDSEEVDGSLRLKQLLEEREYVNKIRSKWLRFEPMGRTTSGIQKEIQMLLEDPKSKDAILVNFPDVYGEIFNVQFESRHCTDEYAKLARSSDGILLFLHPQEKGRRVLISDVDGLIGASPATPSPETINWDPKYASTQVKIVDLLQIILKLRDPGTRISIAVIISAWDLVRKANERSGRPQTPTAWLGREYPLLKQFLVSYEPAIRSEVFGISAQGGDLKKDIESLRKEGVASHRIIIEGGNASEHDITAPVKWVLGTALSGA